MAWCVGSAKIVRRGNAVMVTKAASGTAKIDPVMAAFCRSQGHCREILIAYAKQRRARLACYLAGNSFVQFRSRNGGRVAPSAVGPARALPGKGEVIRSILIGTPYFQWLKGDV
jgi:hypothetical protein